MLGLIGLFAFWPIAPFAWIMGRRELRQADGQANSVDPGERSKLRAGTALGLVGTTILVLGVVAIGGLGLADLLDDDEPSQRGVQVSSDVDDGSSTTNLPTPIEISETATVDDVVFTATASRVDGLTSLGVEYENRNSADGMATVEIDFLSSGESVGTVTCGPGEIIIGATDYLDCTGAEDIDSPWDSILVAPRVELDEVSVTLQSFPDTVDGVAFELQISFMDGYEDEVYLTATNTTTASTSFDLTLVFALKGTEVGRALCPRTTIEPAGGTADIFCTADGEPPTDWDAVTYLVEAA